MGQRGGFGQGGRANKGPVFIIVGFVAFILLTGIAAAVLLSKSEALAKVPPPAPAVQPVQAAVQPDRPAVQMVDVIVPVKDVQQGEALQVSMFAKVSRPANSLPQNLVRNYDELKGQFSKVMLPALEPVTYSVLTRDQPLNAVADMIPIGFRAVTINVNALTGVEGWASPGAQVDVQWVTTESTGKGDGQDRKALLLVQNAKVLSAERQVDPNATVDPSKPIPTTITLMTSAKDALKISLAAQTGQLVLNLRGTVDSGKASTASEPLTSRDIMRSRLDDEGRKFQGKARIRRADGTYEELAVVDGQLLSRVN